MTQGFGELSEAMFCFQRAHILEAGIWESKRIFEFKRQNAICAAIDFGSTEMMFFCPLSCSISDYSGLRGWSLERGDLCYTVAKSSRSFRMAPLNHDKQI